MFEDFDFSALDDPAFKEDAVREEIVAPILRRLGYRPSGDIRVERSKRLTHPFTMIGSKRHPIKLVPDYTLYSGSEALMVLDAKSPSQEVSRSTNVEQVYSYATHPEIRCEHFGLCNGRELIVYKVLSSDPVLRILVQDIDERWPEVVRALDSRYLALPDLRGFNPDYGVHAFRSGVRSDTELFFLGYHLQVLSGLANKEYTAASGGEIVGRQCIVSFDFSEVLLDEILRHTSREFSEQIRRELHTPPGRADLDCKVAIDCRGHLGTLTAGVFESFVPIVLDEILDVSFDPNRRCEPNPLEERPSRKALEIIAGMPRDRP